MDESISHYKILKKLGEGGMGEVYLAEDIKLNRKVALKFLPAASTRDRDAHDRFKREARAAAALNHPNIVTVYEIDEHDGQTYMAMEYVEGESLRDAMARGPLPVAAVIDYAAQICAGLAAAHRAGIVHRDIKPRNIVINKEGRVKILDFGLAKLMGVSPLTRDRSTLGTVHYMSPEQAQGREVDLRTDIWSLGVVLFEMLTGERPFRGAYEQAVMYAIINEEPAPIDISATGTPKGLVDLILTCLRKDPENRPADLDQCAASLRGVDGAHASPAAPPPPIQKRISSKTIITAAMIAIAAAFLAWLVPPLFRSGDGPIDSLAVLPFVNQSPQKDTAWLSTGIPETVISSLQRIPNLRITSFLSLLERYKDTQPTVGDVKKHYNVRAVGKGRVTLQEKQLSIHIEIVDTRDNSIIFAGQYHADETTHLFDLQKTIARDITENLKFKITGDAAAPTMIRHRPDNAAHYSYLRGRHFLNKKTPKDLRKAETYFKQAIDADQQYALAWSGLADTYLLMDQYGGEALYRILPKAREAAEEALRLDDTLAETHASMGLVLHAEHKYEEAEKHYQRAIDINPNYTASYHRSAMNLSDMRRYQDAIRRAQQCLDLDPNSPLTAGNMALTYRRLGNYPKAMAVLDEAIQNNPDYYALYTQYSFIYSHQKKYAKAIEMADKALALAPDNPWVNVWTAHTHRAAGDLAGGVKILTAMMEKEPILAREAHQEIAAMYQWDADFPAAVGHYKKALAIDPLDADIHSDLGGCHMSMRQYAAAAESLAKAVELAPDAGWYRWRYALVLSILGKRTEELEQITTLSRIGPQFLTSRALYHLYYNEYDQALTWARKAEEVNPGDYWNSWYAFQCYLQQGKPIEAEKNFTQFLERIGFKQRESLRRQAIPDGVVNGDSLRTYMRLLLEWLKEKEVPAAGSFNTAMRRMLYFFCGDVETTLKMMRHAVDEQWAWIPWRIRAGWYRPLRKDPRYRELIRKLKLEPYMKQKTPGFP